jgi:hypothetical protein
VPHARANLRLESDGALVRGDRCVEQPAVSAGAHQAGQQLGIGGVHALDQSDHRIVRASEIDLELREQLVRDGQIRIELECLPDLPDAEVQSLLEVDEGIAPPDVIAELRPGDHLAAPADQQFEDLERLRRELDHLAAPPQLPGRRIELERSKSQDGGPTHRELIEYSSRVNWKGQARGAL